MEAQIVFKVRLRAHGEVSPAFIQRLRSIKTYVDKVFGPAHATVRDEADVRYEQIQANGIDRTEGWDLTCPQPVFFDDADFSCGQPDDFVQGGTEVPTIPYPGDANLGLSTSTFEPQFDVFPPLDTQSSIFSGQTAQSSPTHRFDHEYTTASRFKADCGGRASPSETGKLKWKAYNPDKSESGSAKRPKRRKENKSTKHDVPDMTRSVRKGSS